MKKILIAALMASVASTAFAADLPYRKAPPQAPVYAPPLFTWTGFYVGVNGGYAWGDPTSNNFIGGGSVFGHPNGGFAGGTAGYNYQIGQFVMGLEGTLDWADISNNRTFADGSTVSMKVNSTANILARLGFAMDRTLFYVAGGYAGADVHASAFNDTLVPASFPGSSEWRSGYAIGGGVEYALTNNISVKGEYIFSALAPKTYYAGTPDQVKAGLDLSTFKVGVNYKF